MIAVILAITVTVGFIYFSDSGSAEEIRVFRISSQDNLKSAPLFVIEGMGLLEKYIDNVKVVNLNNESMAAMNEAFAGRQIDAGLLSITNVFVGIDRNIPYKIALPVSYSMISIQTNNPDIKSLVDLTEKDLISIPNHTGLTAMVLHLASQAQLGDYRALQNQIVLMNTFDGYTALVHKAGITLHVTDFTLRIMANEAGFPTIIEDKDVSEVNSMTNLWIVTDDFYNKNRDIHEAYLKALEEAVFLINSRDERALGIITSRFDISREDFELYMDMGYIQYSTNMAALNPEPYADIAHKSGIISANININDHIIR
jgi:NitT/TauT family transport system substrate-binding protein